MTTQKKPAGRPLEYGEPTKREATYVPVSKIPEFRAMAAEWLKQFKVKR